MALLRDLQQYKERGQKFTGVFYLEHPTRKNGVQKDKQLVIRFTIAGKTRTEVLGWQSQGWTAQLAQEKIKTFRANHKIGIGPTSHKEDLAMQSEDRKREEARRLEQRRRNVTLADYFYDEYLSVQKQNKKAKTVGSEIALFKKWIEPTMGDRRIREIVPLDFQRLRGKVLKGDRCVDDKGNVFYKPKSSRTLHYCVSVVTQVWNMAFDNKVVDVQPPRRRTLNLPMIDNERTRAFTPEEAREYFARLDQRSSQWADITRVSLFTGLRASEVFKLEINHFDKSRGVLFLKSPKKQKSQTIVLNDSALELFGRLLKSHSNSKGLFFVNRKEEPITEVSNAVQRTIDELGFNDGITDKRERLTFHSWRHTFATWLRDNGADMFEINRLCRHTSMKMTERYVHPQEAALRNVAKKLDDALGVTTASSVTQKAN